MTTFATTLATKSFQRVRGNGRAVRRVIDCPAVQQLQLHSIDCNYSYSNTTRNSSSWGGSRHHSHDVAIVNSSAVPLLDANNENNTNDCQLIDDLAYSLSMSCSTASETSSVTVTTPLQQRQLWFSKTQPLQGHGQQQQQQQQQQQRQLWLRTTQQQPPRDVWIETGGFRCPTIREESESA